MVEKIARMNLKKIKLRKRKKVIFGSQQPTFTPVSKHYQRQQSRCYHQEINCNNHQEW